ncbi:unnamed protein product [Ectocarpus sp. 12 AP-2014]
MDWFLDATQIVIFVSYFVISCVLFYVYLSQKSCIDTCVNRVLLVTAGLFVMLCALTHLHAVWSPKPSAPLLFMCALASVVSAVCSVWAFRGLGDHRRLRVETMDSVRDETIFKLTKGFDLNVRVSGSTILDGVVGANRVLEPQFIPEGFRVNGTVKVGEQFFRIASIVEPFVQPIADGPVRSADDRSSLERGDCPSSGSLVSQVYGYDTTAEVRVLDETERMSRMKMELCVSTAHHARTPLSCLGIALTCLRSRLDTAESYNLLDEAVAHSEMINLYVSQFVDLARFDSFLAVEPVVD